MATTSSITGREQIEADLENAKIAARNVAEDLQVEKEKLAATNAKDEALLESIGEGLIAVDNDRKIMVMNTVAIDMLGWQAKDLIGTVITDLPLEDEAGDIIPLDERPTTIALVTGKLTKVNYFFVRKDKTRFPMAITATPIRLSGKTIGLIEIIRDITRETELDRAKSEFISIASHQLRTPLTGIQWVVERFTKKEKLTSKGREYLEDIHTSVQRLGELVDLMLSLSRIEAGKIGITPEPIEVVDFVRNYLKEAAVLCEKKELRMIFEEHPARLTAQTDKSALRNIVQNIVSNAIEYTPSRGRIEVVIKKKKDMFLTQVGDTGIGIPGPEQSQIFDKFVRASNAKLYKTNGTGIGLYIANQAARLLGGRIWFESKENKGSTFYVELPLEFKPKKEQQPITQ